MSYIHKHKGVGFMGELFKTFGLGDAKVFGRAKGATSES